MGEAVIAIIIFAVIMYIFTQRQKNTTPPVKGETWKEYYDEGTLTMTVKKRGPKARSWFHVASLYETHVNDNVHDYQILSRNVFGVTQTKVIDLGPEEKKEQKGYAVCQNGGGYYSFLTLSSGELRNQAKSSKIKHLVHDNAYGSTIWNDSLSKEDAEKLLSWLSGED